VNYESLRFQCLVPGVHPPVESGWFNNTRAHTGTIFFAAADAVVALQMTVQGENSENTDVNRDGSHIAGRAYDPAGSSRQHVAQRSFRFKYRGDADHSA